MCKSVAGSHAAGSVRNIVSTEREYRVRVCAMSVSALPYLCGGYQYALMFTLPKLKTAPAFALGKCHQFSQGIKWQTFRKTGCYWAEGYATSQLHKWK